MKRTAILFWMVLAAGLVRAQDDGVYQWAAEVPGIVSKETKAPPRAYLWIPPQTKAVRALVVAQHNMLEEPVFAHPKFRDELAKADVGLVWITPMVMQQWDRLADGELTAIEATLAALGEQSGHSELGTVPLAPFGHSAMATYPYLFAAARPSRTFCAVSIKGEWPAHERPCWTAAVAAAKARVPLLLVSGEYEDGFNRREKARELMREVPGATFSTWIDVGGGHFDWSDELCRGLGLWFAEMARLHRPKGVEQNGFWYPTEKLAKLVGQYEALPRGRGRFSVLGYEYGGETLKQNPKAHLQVVFGTKAMDFAVRPVFTWDVPEGRPETWTGLKAGAANPRPDISEETRIVLEKIQGPVESLGGNKWAVRYNRYDPRGYRSREASLQMVYPGSKGFKRSVQQGLVRVPPPRTDFADGGTVSVAAKDFPKAVPADHGAYVREGPATVEGGRIVLRDVPRFAKRPLAITVCTYDLARKDPPVLMTYLLK